MPLNHEVRRGIVGLLRDGDKTAGAIADALGRRRPNVSYHLSFLLSHGVVLCRTEGKNRIYSLDTPTVLAAWNAYVNQPPEPAAPDVVGEKLGSSSTLMIPVGEGSDEPRARANGPEDPAPEA